MTDKGNCLQEKPTTYSEEEKESKRKQIQRNVDSPAAFNLLEN